MNLSPQARSRAAMAGLMLALATLTGCDGTSGTPETRTGPSTSSTLSTVATQHRSTAPSGILYLRTRQGDSAARASTTLNALDPATGASTVVREFVHPNAVAPSIDKNKAIRARNSFSPDLQRMAATKTVGTENHVGWIDASNAFIDISAANHSANSFANKPDGASPTFDANGGFYYIDLVAKAVMRVPPGATTAQVVRAETFNVTGALRDNVRLYVSPSGTVSVDREGGKYLYAEQEKVGTGGVLVDDWLSDDTFISQKAEVPRSNPLYVCTTTPPARAHLLDCADTPLTPRSSDQAISTPVTSPDASRIAFVARRDGTTKVFFISAVGGVPLEIENFAVTGDVVTLIQWLR
ncbi:hypothetical protein [Nocardia fluminea]|uniref:hypothetical protein n=1 Tax=Nocardia fluminea TaxID=134984 RepID=UPI00364FF190